MVEVVVVVVCHTLSIISTNLQMPRTTHMHHISTISKHQYSQSVCLCAEHNYIILYTLFIPQHSAVVAALYLLCLLRSNQETMEEPLLFFLNRQESTLTWPCAALWDDQMMSNCLYEPLMNHNSIHLQSQTDVSLWFSVCFSRESQKNMTGSVCFLSFLWPSSHPWSAHTGCFTYFV